MPAGREIGLIVNPIAGLGGRAGVKGTDTPEQFSAARALGIEATAVDRSRRALQCLLPMARRLRFYSGAGLLGENVLTGMFGDLQLCDRAGTGESSAGSTRRCAAQMLGRGVELLLFAGGDGTARDILASIRDRIPVIGIPCGANMQSGVFAASPEAAGTLALAFLRGECPTVREQEVLGRGGLAPGATHIAPIAYGRLRVPYDRDFIPGPKVSSPPDAAQLQRVVEAAVELLESDACLLFGPGSTKMAILGRVGLTGSLLGVDVVQRGKLVALDANEPQLLRILDQRHRARIVISPVGGQGFLFGRGNQPLSAGVIRAVGVENVSVISIPAKMQALRGRPLRNDLDDRELLRHFPLNVRVITGPGEYQLYPLAPML
ncbi:MAG: NAD(+)/NADH kinase [Gammaproteobacteria bacterium]|nr:NAD(+)/NADH kinase [Gammaproteobacteria bacterium]